MEKSLVNRIKKILLKNKIDFYKTHGHSFQKSGISDLLVFHKNITYALEIKSNFQKSKPSLCQILFAKKFINNLIYLYVDEFNYQFVLKKIIENNY